MQQRVTVLSEDVFGLLWSHNIHYRVRNSPILNPIVSQINPIYMPPLGGIFFLTLCWASDSVIQWCANPGRLNFVRWRLTLQVPLFYVIFWILKF